MASDPSEPLVDFAICVWCEQQYSPPASRARAAALFCSQKCEVEARCWLMAELQTPQS
jgi:hypothetical protein